MPEEETQPLFGSAWELTINSNQTLKEKKKIIKFIKLTNQLVEGAGLVGFIKISDTPPPKNKWRAWKNIDEVREYSDRVDVTGAYEIGPQHHKVHMHLVISYFHFGYAKLDTEALIKWYAGHGLFINTEANLLRFGIPVAQRRYIHKTFTKKKKFLVVTELTLLNGETKAKAEMI